ncbi:MAG: hypothetical protein GY742_09110, partial [Hyphomicrobiales bacterium]|nr:hypothetical protein [Hyphomicrobiales bacterium]
ALITPNNAGDVTVDVPANVAIDVASNGNTTAPDVTATLDNSAPTVTILNAPTSLSGGTSFNVTFEFSEDVTGFVLGDITVGNGTASNFVDVDGNTYTADITPTGAGDVTIDVTAGVAQDTATNPNTAAPTVTVTITIVEDTQKVIANFITNRARHILNNQPDLISFLNGTNTAGGGPLGNLNLTANASNMNLAFSSSLSRMQRIAQQRINRAFDNDGSANPAAEKQKATDEPQTMAYEADWLNKSSSGSAEEKLKAYSKDDEETYALEGINGFDVWTEVHGSRSVSGTAESSLWVGYVGAHKLINPDLLIGGLLQLDWADETNSSVNSSADGFGWMIGPYIAGRIPGQNLSYEARASWGRSSNDVSPIGTYTDGFGTTRWMASGKIAGNYRIDDLSINPFISAAWYEENQENYTDNLGNSIPEQTVSLGEIRFGPKLMREIALENGGEISSSFGVSGVWNFGISDNAASQGNALGDEQLRARFEAGITATNTDGWQLIIAGYYDGVGADDYYAYGGNARLVIPLP